MKRILSVVSGLILLLVGVVSLSAQGIITGKLSGSVVDPTGAVIPGATVTATRASTNTSSTATSGSDGAFSLNDLAVGTYTLTINVSGFAPLTLKDIEITGNRVLDLGAEKLSTGSANETVEVSTAQALLETTAAQVTTTFDSAAITNLPTGGGFDELALLIPGVVSTHGNGFSNTNGAGISSNGQRGRSNNFELDGQSNNDNSVAGPQVFFSNDEALAEVQIITNNFSAEYGRNMGSVVNYITKSGTNAIHGSGIYRYSGDFTSSLQTGASKGPQFGYCAKGEDTTDGCIVPVVPRYVDNQYGGTIGVPVIKDKLFAFGATYFQRFYENGGSANSGASLFPTPAGLATLATTYPGSPAVALLQQLSPYAVTAGNPHPTGTPVFETVSNGTTPASIPFSSFSRAVPQVTTDQEDLGRIDYHLTPKDVIFVRYFYQKNPTAPDGATANGGFVNVRDAVHSVGADITHTFSPRWVDQLRYSFQQSTLAFDGGGFPNCTISSFATCASSVSLGSLESGDAATGLGLPNNLPQGRIVKVGQVQDNATWSVGRHSITFGGEFDYQNSPNVFLPNAAGTFTFPDFDSFLAGGCDTCTLSLTAGNPTIPFKEKDVAVYFQDNWKVTPSLTVNVGLRWEFFQQALNLLHRLSVAQQTGPNPFWSTTLPLSETTFPAIDQSYRNFEPRIGFAYSPAGMKKLVVRGGYAINVDPGFYNINLNSATAAPLVNAGTVTCTVATNCLPTGGATFATVTAQDLKFIPSGNNCTFKGASIPCVPGDRNQTLVPTNFKQPFAQSYTFGVQYQVGNAAVVEVRYAGNHVSGQFQTLNANPYLLTVATAFPNFVSPSSLCTLADSTLPDHADVGRLHCGNTNVRVRANTAFSIYNSLQTSITTRNYRGITATAAYTFSRAIDNSSEIFGTFGAGNTQAFAQNPLDVDNGERAVSGNSYPNVASLAFTYELPKIGSTGNLVGKLINGWQLNTIYLFNSGQPYNDYDLRVVQSPVVGTTNESLSYCDAQTSSAFGSSVDFCRPILSNPKAPANSLGVYLEGGQLVDYATGDPVSRSAVRFIANNRVAAQIAGTPYPGSGRNILRGNTFNNVDASVFKNTKINERINLRFEAQAFNVLNRSYYGNPDNYLGDYPQGSFNNFLFNEATGSNVGVGTGVRNMTFGAKVLF